MGSQRTVRRGNSMMVVSTFGALVGFGALAVDVGMIWVADLQLQQAVDGATLSGASELDGTVNGIDRARATTLSVGSAHKVLGTSLQLTSSSVVVGTYDTKTKTVTPWVSGQDPMVVNTVQVIHNGQPVKVGLGAVAFGKKSYAVSGQSRSIRSGAQRAETTNCYLPIAIPDCHLTGLAPGTNPMPFKFTFQPTPTDAVAWASLSSNPSSDMLRDQINGQCSNTPIGIDQYLNVSEGTNATVLQTIRDTINGSGVVVPTVWNTAAYGAMPARDGVTANKTNISAITNAGWTKVIEGPIALIDGGTNCKAVAFTGTKKITGIAWGIIYDTATSGVDKNIWVQLDVASPHKTTGKGTSKPGPGSNVSVPSPPQTVAW